MLHLQVQVDPIELTTPGMLPVSRPRVLPAGSQLSVATLSVMALGRMCRQLVVAGIIVILASSCGQNDPVVESADLTGTTPTASTADAIDERPETSNPNEDLLDEARAWLESQDLPDEGIPPGFIAIDRLLGECVRSFGIEVLEPEAAYRSGVYYFRSGDQPERVSAINAACDTALSNLGIILAADAGTFTIIYESYFAVHNCLVENGFPNTEPPTLETFIDSPHTWTPWMAMIGDSSPILLVSPPADGPLATYYESLLTCPRP